MVKGDLGIPGGAFLRFFKKACFELPVVVFHLKSNCTKLFSWNTFLKW